jgi:hypothetical protein
VSEKPKRAGTKIAEILRKVKRQRQEKKWKKDTKLDKGKLERNGSRKQKRYSKDVQIGNEKRENRNRKNLTSSEVQESLVRKGQNATVTYLGNGLLDEHQVMQLSHI